MSDLLQKDIFSSFIHFTFWHECKGYSWNDPCSLQYCRNKSSHHCKRKQSYRVACEPGRENINTWHYPLVTRQFIHDEQKDYQTKAVDTPFVITYFVFCYSLLVCFKCLNSKFDINPLQIDRNSLEVLPDTVSVL